MRGTVKWFNYKKGLWIYYRRRWKRSICALFQYSDGW